MALIPPAEQRRKAGNGPSPYFSSVLGLFGGLILWWVVSGLVLRAFLDVPASADGTIPPEQFQRALEELARAPHGPFVLVAPQLVFAAVALALAFLSRVSMRNRLALHPLRVEGRTLLLAACGMLGMQGLVISLAPLLGEPSDQLRFLTDLVRDSQGVRVGVILLLVGVVPALCEELFFRGYVQSRLVAIWPPGAAVLLTSTVFACVHIDPQHVIAVLPIGLYLGWVAWRAGSVWASMLLHALNNCTAVLVDRTLGDLEPGAGALPFYGATALLLALGFVGARALARSGAAAETARLSREGLEDTPATPA